MWWRKREEPVVQAPEALPAVQMRELLGRITELEHALDDLDDQFRRFRARVTKRMADDAREEAASPAPPDNGRLSIAQLKASGRWPLR